MTSAVNIVIKAGGKDLSNEVSVIGFDSHYICHGIPEARLVLREAATGPALFKATERKELEPGSKIDIALNYLGDPKAKADAFKGIITRRSLKVDRNGARLVIDCHDPLIKLVEPRLTQRFKEASTDKDVITLLLKNAGLKPEKLAATKAKHPQLIIFDDDAWSFIKYRAEANGLLVMPRVTGLTIDAADKIKGKSHEVKLNQMLAVDLQLDVSSALGEVSVSGWDIAKQAATKPAKGAAPKIAGGPMDSKKAAKAMGRKPWKPVSGNAPGPEELAGWSAGEMVYRELDRYQGQLTLPGRGDIQQGDKVKLIDTSKSFAGEYLVTGIRHRVNSTGWQTVLRIGLPLTRTGFFKGLHKVHQPMRGLLTGVVKDFKKKEKTDLFRVAVKVAALGSKDNLVWARLAGPFASKETGLFLPPRPGDEVVLGWFGNSSSEPVILGSVHNPKNKPPAVYADKDNEMARGLVLAKDKLSWQFNQKEVSHTLTVGDDKHTLVMSGKEGLTITQDKHKLAIGKAIDVESDKDITLKAKAKLNMEPGADATIKAGGKCAIQAAKTEIK
ncbi:phage baseplate assembly protein V [Endozoicomonadaceae bacterium StTr2]